MQRSALINPTPVVSREYSFANQEVDYSLFRPQWPVSFARAALEHADIRYISKISQWLGLENHIIPVIVIIGSGAGADAQPFLELGCIVYGIEPNAELRRLAVEKFSSHYPNFISIDGDAHTLNLPEMVKADLIVCAQALHTFSAETTGYVGSEGLARQSWKDILPNDQRNRLSIWYYNIDASVPAVVDLDAVLKQASVTYAKSKTPFLNAPMLEPQKFQHYIAADAMAISTAQFVDQAKLNSDTMIRWLRSFSFYPKVHEEERQVICALHAWFERNKNVDNEVVLPFYGFISQGPLRATPYFQTGYQGTKHLVSPISLAMRNEAKDEIAPFWPTTNLVKRPSPV